MTQALPQLFMRNPDLSALPRLSLPEDLLLHTHREGTEAAWEKLIEDAFGTHFSFDSAIRNAGDYRPEYVLYISRRGRDIATTTAVEKDIFPGEGWLRMVAVSPEARGAGVGKLIVLAALHSLAERGYKTAVLSTDDFRLPAIRLYLSLGFQPLCNHESHKARWQKVFSEIQKAR